MRRTYICRKKDAMQLLASTSVAPYLAFVGVVLLVGLVAVLAAAPVALREARRDRRARRESIPTYYGRLHFAH
jgi:hypothetical protein